MRKLIDRFLAESHGATAIEYALVASLIAAVLVTAMGVAGTNLGVRMATVDAAVR